ncbi:LytTR family DNA-binding domain-containing protein [Chitinophaga sp. Cy-1792]|uniref:LytTR family DNA-binding domain-containing protein n=1 Tax=Chitinophaga sp. Cy-1792 TaxID=2608339 RepID=UPI001420262B|nr:LytTR family DNA-binding domain-containing protein [Chitinophaga sp. Cy-1792]NIG54166.1 hypothetical protein [Chitinophaga sp. Cy-1792]
MKALSWSIKKGVLSGSHFLREEGRQRFALLDAVSNRIVLILFIALFSYGFMYVFMPFNMNIWYEDQHFTLATILLIFTGCGALAMAFSQFILSRLAIRRQLSNSGYLFWFALEIILIGAVVTMVNAAINPGIFLTFGEFLSTLPYITLIISIPYSLALLWFYTRQKMDQVRELTNIVPVAVPAAREPIINIRDENDKLVLSLPPEKLLLVKAEDNYVHIFYQAGNLTKKELVRTSLKKVEATISMHGFNRSHRSYVINIGRVVLFHKQAKGYFVCLEGLDDMQIPVSGSYLEFFTARFSQAV